MFDCRDGRLGIIPIGRLWLDPGRLVFADDNAKCPLSLALVGRSTVDFEDHAAVGPQNGVGSFPRATVSCSGTEITIQCNDHDVKDRLMDFLTGSPEEEVSA